MKAETMTTRMMKVMVMPSLWVYQLSNIDKPACMLIEAAEEQERNKGANCAPRLQQCEAQGPCQGQLALLRNLRKLVDQIIERVDTQITDLYKSEDEQPGGLAGEGGDVRRWTNAQNLEKEQIRDHFEELLGGDGSGYSHQASPEEVAEYAERCAINGVHKERQCCDSDMFRLDLQGQAQSAWNRSAAEVFALDFIKKNNLVSSTHRRVIYLFFQHLKYLQCKLKLKMRGDAAVAAAAQRNRRALRRDSLYHRQLRTAQWNEFLKHHVRIIKALGVNGMSSDESDTDVDGDMVGYRVRMPEWRSPSLTSWLHAIDSVYMMERRKTRIRGALPHLRIYALGPFSTSERFVAGLPINAYSQPWLAKTPNVSTTVSPLAWPYDFTLANDIFRTRSAAQAQVNNFSGACYRGYASIDEALSAWDHALVHDIIGPQAAERFRTRQSGQSNHLPPASPTHTRNIPAHPQLSNILHTTRNGDLQRQLPQHHHCAIQLRSLRLL
ncbi:unnamed protein product [Cyclocybe aegerita]|uniref:Ribonuclease H1 N-terminal domain-containing protein n=1 Tax=Cyclocybe aegerita TaxID=1973307 RepID=A0A8S0X8Y7_CYCAE|nr:unnamed protein product [Cyclocybe aegerita]